MSILGSVLKVCGTVIEGTGKVICDVVETVENEHKEYRASEQYTKDKAERQVYINEMKDSWNRIKENGRELAKTYNKGNSNNK